jgi:hypothetical protein
MATGLQNVIDAVRADVAANKAAVETKTTPEDVRGLINEALDATETTGVIQFKGFIGGVENPPETAHLRDGYLWAQTERAATPDFEGVDVKRWDAAADDGAGAWVDAEYTPSIFHLWSDVNEGYKGYYIFPLDEWNALDFSINPEDFATAEQGEAAEVAVTALAEVSYEPVYAA